MVFPSGHASSPSPTGRDMRMATTKLTTASSRDKRRFYIKKSAIAIEQFKAWDESLGDAWYRHHNKVNNIVYYHCKHEPCYASMKAKVMVDFVQLYVTEEGHTHPPYPAIIPSSSVIAPNPDQNSLSLTQDSILYPDYLNASVKRRRGIEDSMSSEVPVMYRQHIYNEFMRIQADGSEMPQNESRANGSSLDDLHSLLYRIEQTTGNQSIIMGPPQHSPAYDIKPSVSNQNSVSVSISSEIPQPVGASDDGADKEPASAATVSTDENSVTMSADNASPNSSVVSAGSQPISNAVPTTSTCPGTQTHNAAQRDAEDDFSSSCSDDEIGVYSPVNTDPSTSKRPLDDSSGKTSCDLFHVIRAKVECQPVRKRLRTLRKLKRQLSYYVEMEEVKYLTSRLPPSVKYDDIFERPL